MLGNIRFLGRISRMSQKTAIIIGAGPAGLTAAYELLEKSDIKPIVFEMSDTIGGIARTVNYKGNRIDIGGHRFFSKSDRVMDWWKKIMPLQSKPSKDDLLLDRQVLLSEAENALDPEEHDSVMLARNRLSRIFFLRKFFDYPVSLSKRTLMNLGLVRTMKIGFSYLKVRFFPIKKEKNLEDFFINRFGRELYATFFKDYTEKVWGVPCTEISSEWGAQRIKGLSIKKAVWHAMKSVFKKSKSLAQKDIETSLIGHFMYPKYGPGQMWEEVTKMIKEKGAEVHMEAQITGIYLDGKDVREIEVTFKNGEKKRVVGDFFFSTMPIKELVEVIDGKIAGNVKEVAQGLSYRDFITVGLLLKKLKIGNETLKKTVGNIPPDNWIYIQERDVKVGRLQIFNNWSPYMVKDLENTVWLGLEYFCNIGDELWSKSDEEFIKFAIDELAKIDIINKENVLDATIIRMPKTYPSYFGTYNRFGELREFLDGIENLFLVGRNGMHKYNNQDHSMLTAMTAVENILSGRKDKSNIWAVNTEMEYHEKK